MVSSLLAEMIVAKMSPRDSFARIRRKKLKDPHYRYCPSGKFGTHFVRYADSHVPLHVQMDASESAFGERVVTLSVHLYRANGGEISDREGRMSATEYEAWKTRRTKTGVH